MKYALLAILLIGCASPTAPTPAPPTRPAQTSPCLEGGTWTGTTCEYDDPKPSNPAPAATGILKGKQ